MAESAQMPRYVCHKIVHALKIIFIDGGSLIPENPNYGPIGTTLEWRQEKKAIAPGYYVVYEDGYTSWSPVEAFEKGYTPITDAARPGLTNEALQRRVDSLLSTLKHVQTVLTPVIDSLNQIAPSTCAERIARARAAIALADSELATPKPDGVALQSRQHSPNTVIGAENELEAALIELTRRHRFPTRGTRMSYDIYLEHPETGATLELDQPHDIAGGTRIVGGTADCWMNVTYNYSPFLYDVLGSEKGIREIYGKSGAESIPLLERGIAELKSDEGGYSYWESTEGNARRALEGLLVFAKAHPEGIWRGD